MRRCDDPEPAIPEAEWARFLETALNAQLAARAGFVGTAGCLLEAARRRAERAEAAGEPWAAEVRQELEAASEQLASRYGRLDPMAGG